MLNDAEWWRVEGGGRSGEKGREVYGRREKMGRDARFPRWRGAEELRNIAQYFASEGKKRKEAGV